MTRFCHFRLPLCSIQLTVYFRSSRVWRLLLEWVWVRSARRRDGAGRGTSEIAIERCRMINVDYKIQHLLFQNQHQKGGFVFAILIGEEQSISKSRFTKTWMLFFSVIFNFERHSFNQFSKHPTAYMRRNAHVLSEPSLFESSHVARHLLGRPSGGLFLLCLGQFPLPLCGGRAVRLHLRCIVIAWK